MSSRPVSSFETTIVYPRDIGRRDISRRPISRPRPTFARRIRLAHPSFGDTTPRTRALTRTFRDAPIARLRLRWPERTRPRFHHRSVAIAVLAILQPLGVAAVRTRNSQRHGVRASVRSNTKGIKHADLDFAHRLRADLAQFRLQSRLIQNAHLMAQRH